MVGITTSASFKSLIVALSSASVHQECDIAVDVLFRSTGAVLMVSLDLCYHNSSYSIGQITNVRILSAT